MSTGTRYNRHTQGVEPAGFALFRLVVSVCACRSAEVYHSVSHKELKARLPLLWFDRLLRRWGPLLPAPVLAVRLAADVAALLASGQEGLGSPAGSRLRHHLAETAVVYSGIIILRAVVYGLHYAGVSAAVPAGPCHCAKVRTRLEAPMPARGVSVPEVL